LIGNGPCESLRRGKPKKGKWILIVGNGLSIEENVHKDHDCQPFPKNYLMGSFKNNYM